VEFINLFEERKPFGGSRFRAHQEAAREAVENWREADRQEDDDSLAAQPMLNC
jgi:hypothetical protein